MTKFSLYFLLYFCFSEGVWHSSILCYQCWFSFSIKSSIVQFQVTDRIDYIDKRLSVGKHKVFLIRKKQNRVLFMIKKKILLVQNRPIFLQRIWIPLTNRFLRPRLRLFELNRWRRIFLSACTRKLFFKIEPASAGKRDIDWNKSRSDRGLSGRRYVTGSKFHQFYGFCDAQLRIDLPEKGNVLSISEPTREGNEEVRKLDGVVYGIRKKL